MDGMLGAIRNKRSGGLIGGDEEQAPAPQPQGESSGLKGLVAALDESQKAQLLKMLVSDQASEGEDAPELEKGGMGPGESQELEEYVSEMEPEEDHESEDELAESMISSADKSRAEQGVKPRNLGERMRVGLANKLKKKG